MLHWNQKDLTNNAVLSYGSTVLLGTALQSTDSTSCCSSSLWGTVRMSVVRICMWYGHWFVSWVGTMLAAALVTSALFVALVPLSGPLAIVPGERGAVLMGLLPSCLETLPSLCCRQLKAENGLTPARTVPERLESSCFANGRPAEIPCLCVLASRATAFSRMKYFDRC